MKSNQVQARMPWEYIEIIERLARASHMTPSAMLRRLVLERLEQLGLSKAIEMPRGKNPLQAKEAQDD